MKTRAELVDTSSVTVEKLAAELDRSTGEEAYRAGLHTAPVGSLGVRAVATLRALSIERDRLKAALEACLKVLQGDYGNGSVDLCERRAIKAARAALSPTQEAGDE